MVVRDALQLQHVNINVFGQFEFEARQIYTLDIYNGIEFCNTQESRSSETTFRNVKVADPNMSLIKYGNER